jgi:competence ComEA-like helix-hairpin-helix protein
MTLLFFFLFLQQPTFKADTSSVEWIRAWFSQPSYSSDGTVPQNSACYLMDPLILRIDSATASIDLVAYDIENDRVVDALVRARARGVKVRVVTDNYMRTDSPALDQPIWEKFRKAGIVSIDDDGDVYWSDGSIADTKKPNAGAQMHHKFAVFDRDTPTRDDDYVWTGSTNITLTCVINSNTVLVIKDPAVARIYREEFEQMWGGSGDLPDPKKAVFHKDKGDVSQHRFWVGDAELEVYFAPVDKPRKKPSISGRIVQLIQQEAQHEIAFGAFSISSGIPVSQAMWEASEKNVRLLGVIDRRFYSRYEKNNDRWASAEARTGNRFIAAANELRILHHKTILLDADADRSDDVPVVITGSYNFSNAAEFNNDENLLVIRSKRLARQFYADFQGLYRRARNEMAVPAPVFDSGKTYPVAKVHDGGRLEVEVTHGFTYEVRLLGVDAPFVFPKADSVSAWAETSGEFLSVLAEGGYVSIHFPAGVIPESRNGAVAAYVNLHTPEGVVPLNRKVLESGMAKYSRFGSQTPDSVLIFKQMEDAARQKKTGIWAEPSKWDRKSPNKRKSGTRKESKEADVDEEPQLPVNINTADVEELQRLPRVGPATAEKILELRAKLGGRFKSVEELGQVKGIGPKTLENIRPMVVLD